MEPSQKKRSLLLAPLFTFLTTNPTILTSNAPLFDDPPSPLPSHSLASIISLLSIIDQAYILPHRQAPWTIYLCRLLVEPPFPSKLQLDIDTMWQPDFVPVSCFLQAPVATVNLLSFSGTSTPVEQPTSILFWDAQESHISRLLCV